MISKIKNILLLAFSIIILTGCTRQVILSENLSPKNLELVSKPYEVELVIDGGREKDALGLPKITNEKLLEAVEKTVLESKLFKNVVKSSDYKLELFIVRLGQPVAGSMMKANIEIAWTLKKDGNIVWRKSIVTSKAKHMSEIGNALERVIVATEEATKLNIEEGLTLLSTLDI